MGIRSRYLSSTDFNPAGRPMASAWCSCAGMRAMRVTCLVAASGGEPVRISETPAYYTSPVFTPDGREILALRSSNALRMHSYMEYGALRQCELVRMSVPQGPPRSNAVAAATPAQVVTRGLIGDRKST